MTGFDFVKDAKSPRPKSTANTESLENQQFAAMIEAARQPTKLEAWVSDQL